jgi:hypothetical protein
VTIESKTARSTRRTKEVTRGRTTERFLRRGRPGKLLGPLVKEFQLPMARDVLLVRRLDLASMAGAGVWPGPISQAVRRMIIDGPVAPYQADEKRFTETAMAVARAACIVPPPALLDGAITIDGIEPDACRPLFVEVDPADDQYILKALTVTKGATPEAAAEETARQVQEAETAGNVMVFQPFDLVALMRHVIESAPGADGRFRLGGLLGLAGVAGETGDGDVDQSAAQA